MVYEREWVAVKAWNEMTWIPVKISDLGNTTVDGAAADDVNYTLFI